MYECSKIRIVEYKDMCMFVCSYVRIVECGNRISPLAIKSIVCIINESMTTNTKGMEMDNTVTEIVLIAYGMLGLVFFLVALQGVCAVAGWLADKYFDWLISRENDTHYK